VSVIESAGAFSSDGGGQADQLDESVTGANAANFDQLDESVTKANAKNSASASAAKAQNMLSTDRDASNITADCTVKEQKVLFIADQDGCIVRVDYDREEIAEPSTDKDASNTKAACIARQQKVLFIADQDGRIVREVFDTEETAEPRTDKDANNTNSDSTAKEQSAFSEDQDGSSACMAKEQNESGADRDASIAKTACIATTQTESSTSEHGRLTSRAACTAHEMATEPSGDKDASFNTIVFVEMEEELFSTSDEDNRATTAVCNTEEMTESIDEQDADGTKGVGMGEALKESSNRQESSAAMTPGCVVKPQIEFSAASGVASNTHAAGAPKASEFHTVIPVAVCASSATNCTTNVKGFDESNRGVTISEGLKEPVTGDNSKQQQLKHPHAQLPLRQIQEPEVQAKKERVPCLFTCKICEKVGRQACVSDVPFICKGQSHEVKYFLKQGCGSAFGSGCSFSL
jgi:hypothetical protein